MATRPEDCANYAINLSMCPCTNEGCANRGICCECLRNHVNYGMPTACMGGKQRPADTFTLKGATLCSTNSARNAAWCACTHTECVRHGICCNCVRNHWTADGTGRVACMKGL